MTKLEKILSDYKKGILSDSEATKAILKLQNKEPKISEEPKPVKRETKHNVDPCRSSGNGGYGSRCETEPKSVRREIIHNVDPCRSSGNGGYGSRCETEPKPKKRRTSRSSNYDDGCSSSIMSC